MRETIQDPESKNYFALMNNGVTVVARKVIPTGNRFVIEDYQIVNGCQTSYVLHETREALTEEVLVPVRLIATSDTSIRNSIAKATNRQTSVSDDQLFALSDFPKNLEAIFILFGTTNDSILKEDPNNIPQTLALKKYALLIYEPV